MPKIGKRILKSSLAVFCCFLISFFRQNEGIVFYSCIAAVLCIQQDVTNSKKVGFTRIKGTLLGGLVGMLMLYIERSLSMDSLFIRYLMISIMITPIIYLSVLFKMTSASYISCVVFMSIVISHAADVNPFLFATNRMFDTLIGIFVALIINMAHLPHRHHKETLFVVHLDHVLLHNQTISAYSKVKLKQLLEQGANIVLSTQRTPGSFLPLIKDIPFQLPVIAMNGAVQYDIQDQEYRDCRYILAKDYKAVGELLNRYEMNCFTHTIVNQVLHVYYQPFHNKAEEAYFHQMRKTPYTSYICHEFPDDLLPLYLYIIDKTETITLFYEELKKTLAYANLHVRIRRDQQHIEYSILEMYACNATQASSIQQCMIEHNFRNMYEFIYDERDLCSFANTTYICNTAKKSTSMGVVFEASEDSVVHRIDRIFHSRMKSAKKHLPHKQD